MNSVAKIPTGEMIENVIAKGDLSKLTADERTQYYVQLCRSMGLNQHTQPFAFLTLNGKLTLYAKRDAADQLRKINGISIEIVNRNIEDGLFTVHVRAKDANGRTDEDFGVVPMPDTLKGESRANQILKGITKAKRRVTLSISGLGFLDESEVEDVPAIAKVPTARARNAAIAEIEDPDERHAAAEAAHDQWAEKQAQGLRNAARASVPPHDADGVIWEENGERPATADDAIETESDRLARLDAELGKEAKKGTRHLQAYWKTVSPSDQKTLKAALDKRHKPTAAEADKALLDIPPAFDRRPKADEGEPNTYVDLVSAG